MHPWLRSAPLVGVLMVAGCQPHPLDDPLLRDAPASPGAAAVAASGGQAGALSSPARVEAPPRPTGELSLTDVLSLAVAHHPRLRAYSAEVRAAEARVMQAGRWPNPELGLELENVAGSGRFSGVDAAETTLSLAQTFPLGGDIGWRQSLAEARVQQADWAYEAARLSVLLEATQRFVAAVAADQRIELARRELAWGEAAQRLTVQRVEAGDASPVEKARVVVPVITAELALDRAQRERDAAYRRIAMAWGGRSATFDGLRGRLEALAPPPGAERLVQWINASPEVARWATEVSAALAEQRLAEAEARPDVTGRLGVRHENEDDAVALVVGLSLPVPVLDRRSDAALAARWGAAAARERQREAELRLEAMLSAAYAELAGSFDEAVALRDRALPAATEAFAATRRAFEEGKLPFLDVLDAQRTLFDLERRYLDTLVAYHTAAAEIESLIGRRLTDLNEPPPPQENQP